MPDYADTLIRVAAVLLVALLLTRAAVWLAAGVRSRIDGGEAGSTPRAKRAHTLAGIVRVAAVVAIWLLAAPVLIDSPRAMHRPRLHVAA